MTSDKTFKISEIFMSLEGEALFSSRPTIYIRYAMCNLKCPRFNNHHADLAPSGYAALTFNPKDYTKLTDIPLIEHGCDSQYAVNPEFSHMWETLTTDEIVDRLIELLPKNSWVHPDTGLPVILSLTGGEPCLNAKWFKDLLQHPKMQDCKHVLVETNCTVPVSYTVAGDINQWLAADETRRWSWSNSPKLSDSGEPWDKAIKPKVAMSQLLVTGKFPYSQVDQYFKFVVGDDPRDIEEVKKAMSEYYEGGIPKAPNVWLMPEACTAEQQSEIAKAVAKICIEEGFLYSHRLQNTIWGNGVGT